MTEKQPKEKKYGFYHHKGEKVKVVFKDGKSVTGKLLSVPMFEVILETEDGKELTIFKHAIKYVYVID